MFGDVKRVLEVFDPAMGRRLPLDQHNIKSAGSLGPVPLRQILCSQFRQLRSFAMIHRQQSAAEGLGGPGFDLDEYHDTMVFRHEIQFSDRRPYVAIKNAIPPWQARTVLPAFHWLGRTDAASPEWPCAYYSNNVGLVG